MRWNEPMFAITSCSFIAIYSVRMRWPVASLENMEYILLENDTEGSTC